MKINRTSIWTLAAAMAAIASMSSVSTFAGPFNSTRTVIVSTGYTNPGTSRGLNPQPLPPKISTTGSGTINPGTTRSLNPQPLPPKVFNSVTKLR